MLVPKIKTFSTGDVVTFKLTNGEEIVGKITGVTDSGYQVSKPCTVAVSQQGVALIQSLYSADINNFDVVLKQEHIIMAAPVIKEIESHYIQTTTGIKTATNSGIIT